MMTLDYYNKNARRYSQETLDVDFKEQRHMLLKYLKPGAHILDLGCGAGRDSKVFLQQGYQVTSIDGSKALCEIASRHIGQEVICQRFQDLDQKDTYHGIWACASLLHLPMLELSSMIRRVSTALKAGGYFYASFKYGELEGERNGRYFTDLTEDRLKDLLLPFGELALIETEITKDVRAGREQELWLNFVVKKIFLVKNSGIII